MVEMMTGGLGLERGSEPPTKASAINRGHLPGHMHA